MKTNIIRAISIIILLLSIRVITSDINKKSLAPYSQPPPTNWPVCLHRTNAMFTITNVAWLVNPTNTIPYIIYPVYEDSWMEIRNRDGSWNITYNPTNTELLVKHKPIIVGQSNNLWIIHFKP